MENLYLGIPILNIFLNKHTNAINFEHTMLMTDYYVDYFLNKTGFKILKKESFGNHSFFYSVQKVNNTELDLNISFVSQYKKYKKMFEDFISYHEDMIEEINLKTRSHDGDIYLFGAHIFSQYLISFVYLPKGLFQYWITALLRLVRDFMAQI